jgi:transcription termination factor Rho
MNLTDLKRKPVGELVDMARDLGIENMARQRKPEVIAAILRKQAKAGDEIAGDGTLEILQDGFGFLRSGASTCARATPSPARSGRRRTASATSRC